jgi:2-oxoisovalerate dehydrogenase E1 component alpha subunit
METAVERARRGDGPTLIDAECVRMLPHSSQDDDLYRPREIVEQAQRRDPLPRYRRYLEEQNLIDERRDAALWDETRAIVRDAQDRAELAPVPPPAEARMHLFAEEV